MLLRSRKKSKNEKLKGVERRSEIEKAEHTNLRDTENLKNKSAVETVAP